VTDTAVRRWTWTADLYEQAAEHGLFGREARVELIDGEIYEVSPMGLEHAATIARLLDLLYDNVDRRRWVIGSQLPVRIEDRSEPEPDLWVATAPRKRYDDHHPGPDELALVVEVSDSSLNFDRDVKLPRYAVTRVPEVWIVSLAARVIHFFAAPDKVCGSYRHVATLGRGERVRSDVLGIELAVDDILPA